MNAFCEECTDKMNNKNVDKRGEDNCWCNQLTSEMDIFSRQQIFPLVKTHRYSDKENLCEEIAKTTVKGEHCLKNVGVLVHERMQLSSSAAKSSVLGQYQLQLIQTDHHIQGDPGKFDR